ncbi:hypothetical protein [Fibrobacter sp.]|uniref:hypothetical protein n=1 Tax=Fibrobacter sp. TaxID=35828 RepID=UPI00386B667A
MESLLIFIAIFVIDALIKRANAKKKSEQQQQHAPTDDSMQEFEDERDDENFDENEDSPPESKPFAARKLQEYIKQFEEAQREAAQGTMESPMPPPIPESHHRMGNHVTMREVAENIIQLDVIDIEYLMDEFGMSKGSAIEMINLLQQHRIIGHDMGEGEYDVLVQDITELNNLLAHEQKAEVFAQTATATPKPSASTAASDKQNQLKILEERARRAREEAAAIARQSDIENGYSEGISENADPLNKRTVVRSISRESVRRGFIWGKIIDEPRFKKRWTALSR